MDNSLSLKKMGHSIMLANVDSLCLISRPLSFPFERKRFTAMHELGHLLLDFDDALPQKDVERFCNLFANEMLISQDVFKKLLGVSRHDNRFSSLVYRALASELISFSKASELLNESIYVVREQLELV